ncbi:hypothetical protein [Romboutsia maritimum]|uniref:hypothetical protein n=1 Tax=Romboutsia maritimum TaxID=2020948 RepID=UPI0013147B18|nr:hypothetical protein [Romboutsia maritimum]
MKNITVVEARKLLEITESLAKPLAINQNEFIELMMVYNKIIDRLLKESGTNE